MRSKLRLLGALLIAAGALTLAWAGLVWQWQDPFTYLSNLYEQRQLAASYDAEAGRFSGGPLSSSSTTSESATTAPSFDAVREGLRREARRYRAGLGPGDPLGRLEIPKIGVTQIVVNGTDTETLKKGPGRHLETFLPGEGELVYVAGHRTTYGAPFSDIDQLQAGDLIRFGLPYATYEYAVTGHRIVPATYVQALETKGVEQLALQACWPRFFASHRIIVYAKPVSVRPNGAPSIELATSRADG